MRSATGRWVSGEDFFDREPELRILENRVQEGNHVLLTGQRRMGKTSMVRELERRLTESGAWVTLFTDVEDATCPEDVIADIARPRIRFVQSCRDWEIWPVWDAVRPKPSRRSA